MHALNSKNNHERFMREALVEAEKALAEGNWPIGAVVVIDNHIISRSANKVYTNMDKTHHAELLALQQAAHLLHNQGQRATLYSTYELCPMCLGAALVNHVGTIVCGPDLDGSGAMNMVGQLPMKFLQKKYNFYVIDNVLQKECAEIALRGIPQHKLLSENVAAIKKLYTIA